MEFSGELKRPFSSHKGTYSLIKSRTCTHWYVCVSVHKDLWDSKTTASFRKETNWFVFLLGCNTFIPHLSKYFLFKMQIRIIKCNQSFSWTDLFLNCSIPKLSSLNQLQVKLLFLHNISMSAKIPMQRKEKQEKQQRKIK